MDEKIARIIELLERADELFGQFENINEEARGLWKAGIEKLSGAIWIQEREAEQWKETEDSP